MPSWLRFCLISVHDSAMYRTGVDFSKIRSLVITVTLPVKNDPLLSSGISLKRLTEATILASFQSWSKAPRTVLSFAPSDQLCALTPDNAAWSGSPTGMTTLLSAHTIITLSRNLTANSFKYRNIVKPYLLSG